MESPIAMMLFRKLLIRHRIALEAIQIHFQQERTALRM